MDIIIDIETLPADESYREVILNDVKADFKAPSSLTKTQAAKDLGMTPEEVKFIGLPDLKLKWAEELSSEKCVEVAEEKWRKTALNPDYGRIACIAIKANGSEWVSSSDWTEAKILFELFKAVDSMCKGMQIKFVGHNIGKFDLPFIFKRSVINHIEPLGGVRWIDGRHGQNHFDTMIAWAGFGGRISLDNLAKILNIKGKGDIDGSMVYDAWQDDPQKVIDYCVDDVRMTEQVFNRLTFKG